MEGHFFVGNAPNIEHLLMWGGSFQVPMANSVLRMRTEPELISWNTSLFVDHRLGGYSVMGMGNKRGLLDLSKSKVPGCRCAEWVIMHLFAAKIYQTLKHSSNISLPLWSLLPSSHPQRSIRPFLLSIFIFITFPTKNRHNKLSGHIR